MLRALVKATVAKQALVTTSARTFADPPAKKKSRGGDDAEAVPPASPSIEYYLRLNELRIFKESDMIEEMPDASYPDWLWTIHIPYPTPNEMSEMSYDLMDAKLKKRYYKINRRVKIKDANADTTK